jgi:hypothetical protein
MRRKARRAGDIGPIALFGIVVERLRKKFPQIFHCTGLALRREPISLKRFGSWSGRDWGLRWFRQWSASTKKAEWSIVHWNILIQPELSPSFGGSDISTHRHPLSSWCKCAKRLRNGGGASSGVI